jgi:hypothetical protein
MLGYKLKSGPSRLTRLGLMAVETRSAIPYLDDVSDTFFTNSIAEGDAGIIATTAPAEPQPEVEYCVLHLALQVSN